MKGFHFNNSSKAMKPFTISSFLINRHYHLYDGLKCSITKKTLYNYYSKYQNYMKFSTSILVHQRINHHDDQQDDEQELTRSNSNEIVQNMLNHKRRQLFEWYSTSHNPLSIDAPDSLFSDHQLPLQDDHCNQNELFSNIATNATTITTNNNEKKKKETNMEQISEWMQQRESEMFEFLNEKQLEPRNRTDRYARWWAKRCVARILKFLFGRNMLRYSIFLESMSATPGMVGGMWRHFASLRSKAMDRCKKEHLRVGALLEEAENHRMHMLVLLELTNQNIFERILMVIAQLSFSQYYFYIYSLAGKSFSHRFVGYLAETSVESYGLVLKQIDEKKIPNPPAPEMAINYWNLPKNSTLRDVILAIRMDECKHREFNHALADELNFEKSKK